MAETEPWQVIAGKAQSHRAETLTLVSPALPVLPTPENLPSRVIDLPREYLTARELELTLLTPEKLRDELATGSLKCVEVANAFIRRAAVAQGLANCITELLPDRALKRAAELDEYFAQHGKPIGPLHGLPISVKEHIGMRGLGLDSAFVSKWGTIAEEDAHPLQILAKAGAVFYVRTTQPQTVMHLETRSNLFGITVNPYNRSLTSGGSSGGEGALIALRGSCLGIGSDIGGSVRSPAANCGIHSLRPTSWRLPVRGWICPPLGTENIVPVIGPMSTSISGIKMFMQTLIDAKPWLTEPSLLPIPWKKELTEFPWLQKLKVAVLWDDQVVKPLPPVTRALKEVIAKLEKVPGVQIVEWKPYKHDEAWSIAASLYFVDGGTEEENLLAASGEPWLPLSKYIVHENKWCKRHSIEELWSWQHRRETYREEYCQVWNETASSPGGEDVVDVILAPVGPGPAPPLETAKWWGYTSQWNVLDYPATVFPVTKCDAEVDLKDVGYVPRNDLDEQNQKHYDSANYQGVPVSLQLICRRYEDEKLIGIVADMQKTIGLPFVPFP